MSPGTLGWIALGGAAGSVARALTAWALQSRFPWATLLVNVLGSLLLGWLMGRLGAWDPATAQRGQSLLVIGFCGGFTTFSSFSWQTWEQMQRGAWFAAALNVVLSVGLCLLAAGIGFRVGRP